MILKILDGHANNPGDLSWKDFEKLADVTVYDRTSQEEVVDRISDADAIIINKVVITEDILNQAPNLKYIGVCATGYNVVDLEACSKRGIVVTNVPAYSTDAVAQHVFSFILYFTNHVALHNEAVHKGGWVKSPDFCFWNKPLTELAGKTLGIFGYGSIGTRVAKIGEAFGMKVIVNTRTQKPGMPESVSWKELLSRADYLSLHAPLTPKTTNIINKDSLALMKPSSVLINTARGGFVIEQELADALKAGVIAGYAADVILHEPMNADCPLLGCPNCVLTPHTAWAPKETRERLLKVCFENFQNWINQKYTNVVNKIN